MSEAAHRFAREVSDVELGDYQRVVRLVLRHPLVTDRWPDDKALARVRRFGAVLRRDLADAFGYRLELHGATARLLRAKDELDASQPALTRTGRPFDRQRYAYLALCLAALGRAGVQVTLSELAERVAADANRVAGLGLDADRGADRRAFVDAVQWLEERGALRVADGSTGSWASDPGVGEALYDVSRDVVFALFRPSRVLQHVTSVAALLERSMASSGNAARREAAQAARRAVVERPVVYFGDVDGVVANHLRGTALAADLHRLTGLRVERRAEGVLLVDTANLSVERFPGTGSVAQVAVLLAVAMADRVLDPDGRRARRLPAPGADERGERLVADVDAGLPAASTVRLDDITDSETVEGGGPVANVGVHDGLPADASAGVGDDAPARLPFVSDSALRTEVDEVLRRYSPAFGAQWHADPDRLRVEAVALLERFGAVTTVPGGVVVRPLVGRYRNTVAAVRRRASETLF